MNINFREFSALLTPGRLFLILMFIVIFGILEENSSEFLSLFFGLSATHFLVLYALSYHLLVNPILLDKHVFQKYYKKVAPFILLLLIPVGLIIWFLTFNVVMTLKLVFLNLLFQTIIAAPLSLYLSKRQLKKEAEFLRLKKDFYQGQADIHFLRSQINPHFLFNTLNTLYAAALDEGAKRTSEGIQKLGEMMRFIVDENKEEEILVDKEIKYLNEYIELQRLKTEGNKQISISVEIKLSPKRLLIAPMLLIPILENAFKHGISFREESPIKIELYFINNHLNLNVSNRKMTKRQENSKISRKGLGLKNVRQRLELIYPNDHDFTIDESPDEFSVHMRIKLNDLKDEGNNY